MAENNKRKNGWIWLVVLFLLLCLFGTFGIIVDKILDYLQDDSGAIVLNPDDLQSDVQDAVDEMMNVTPSPTETPTPTEETKKGFETSDENGVWTTNTSVEIFKISYENGEQNVTVRSDNGDQVIAPGTENSYTFKLKNTGEVALDYSVEIGSEVSDERFIPILVRINRYDGKWVTYDNGEFMDVWTLDGVEDSATLGAGRYTYYTLDWKWPFENGFDELDTSLGNLASYKDVTFTITIKTVATESTNPNSQSGIKAPNTGDDSNVLLWACLAGGAALLFMILILLKKKENEDE